MEGSCVLGISEGLSWAQEANDSGRMLLLMTPHALRRPDGYCLNEIARAVSLKLAIFPVLVQEIEPPPPSLHSLPLFDMRDCVPIDESINWEGDFERILASHFYIEKINRLVAILELCNKMTNFATTVLAGIHLRHPRSRSKLHSSESFETTRSSSSSRFQRFLFSYDSTCTELAHMLYSDLTERGCSIYPLQRNVPNEEYIQQGIQWACEESCAKLVLFITSASVGRPNGMSLNHVTAAMNAGMGFVPLMVRICEIPLSICRIQWFDMTDWFNRRRKWMET